MKFHLISQWITSLNSVTLFSLTTILLTILCVLVVKRIQFIQKVDKIPGLPGGITILGNAAMLLVSPEGTTLNCSLHETLIISYVHFGSF